MSTAYPPHYAYPSAPPLLRAQPSPPRLHWGWVLALSIITGGVFSSIWMVVQARWVRRMRGGQSASYWMAIANLAWLPLLVVAGFAIGYAMTLAASPQMEAAKRALDNISRLVSLVLYVVTVFWMRSEMVAEPIDLPLSGGMTFLFGVFYFQYHLRDYGEPLGTGLLLNPASVHSSEAAVPRYPSAAEVGVVLPTAAIHPDSAFADPAAPAQDGSPGA